MSSLLYGLGRWCYRNKMRVIAIWLAIAALLGTAALTIGGSFQNDFKIPSAPSQAALDQLHMTFPEAAGMSALEIIVAPEGSKVTDPEIRDAIEAGMAEMKKIEYVDRVTSPWDEHMEGLVSDDGQAAMVQLMLDFKEPPTLEELQPLVDIAEQTQTDLPEGATASMGGQAFSIELPTLSIIEVLGLVVALVVLLVVLGSFTAALLPLINAVLGVAISTSIMMMFAKVVSINSTTPLLSVMLGLAVGIDYALFVLSRHREQLANGMDAEESAARSVATAGSAVIFAGLTVFIALIGLFVAQIPFLTIMGIFAALGVLVAVIIALTLLPAFMGLLGERMRPKRARGDKAGTADEDVRWDRRLFSWWVGVVTKVPIITILVVVAGLGSLTYPAKDLALSLPNSGQHLPDQADRIAYDRISKHFGPGFNGPLVVTAEIIGSNDPLGVMDGLKRDILATDGVAKVIIATPNQNADTGFVQVIPTTGPDDADTADLVNRLRASEDQWMDRYGVKTAVTGLTAVEIDISDKLAAALLPFGLFVVGLSLVLLTMVFRSLAVPIKATLGYLLSVGAAFGTTTLVFNQGWLKELINLERGMPVISFMPILLMGILFGLAMDYQVFLVSRMREEYVHGRNAHDAITHGFVGSGMVVAGAAVIMFAVFAFFVPEGQGPIKAIAFALAIGVAVDAFLVRMTLVPAVLQLLGKKAWWLPTKLDKRLPQMDVEGDSLAKELALSDWPDKDVVAHVEGLNLEGLVDDFDVSLAPGECVALVGEPHLTKAVLLAIAGRLAFTDGKARVGGELLPQQAHKVRRRTCYLKADPDSDFAHELERAKRFNPKVFVVEGADVLPKPTDRSALNDTIKAAQQGKYGVLLGVADADLITSIAVDRVVPVTPANSPQLVEA